MENLNKNTVFILILLFTNFNNTACLKRVPIRLDAEEIKSYDVVIVHLNSGVGYKLENPKFEQAELTGIYSNQEIRIPLEDIKSIETERPDKKKFIISYAVIMGILAIFAILFYPFGALEDLD